MAYNVSLLDRISERLAPVMRIVSDLNITLMGTQVSVLRLSRRVDEFTGKKHNVFGDKDYDWEATVVNNVLIKYPFSKLELFEEKTPTNTYQVNSFDMTEFLPIELSLQFNGDYEQDPVVLKRGDYIVDVLRDEQNNKIPFVMEIVKTYGSFFGKHIVGKSADMVLIRGELPPYLQLQVDKYVSEL